MNNKEIFTVLYEICEQQFLIGVTNEDTPKIAAQGINTIRPLPQNIKDAIINTVKDIRHLDKTPQFIDYNAPSSRISYSLLGNLTVQPITQLGRQKTIEEATQELKQKMSRGEK